MGCNFVRQKKKKKANEYKIPCETVKEEKREQHSLCNFNSLMSAEANARGKKNNN